MNEMILTVLAIGISIIGLMYTMFRNLKLDMQEFRSEMKSDMQEFRSEMKSDMQGLRSEFKTDMQELRSEVKSDINELRMDVKSELKDINIKLIDMDKRLYAVETLLHMKDCCVLKQDQNIKKAE